MQYRKAPSSNDDILARVRAEMLAERFPVPVALELITHMPLINAWLWFALPPTVRSMFCSRFSSFEKHPQFFDEGGFWYAVLVLATPELDEPERHAKYLRLTTSCATNRRDLLKFMGMTDSLLEEQLVGTCAGGKKRAWSPTTRRRSPASNSWTSQSPNWPPASTTWPALCAAS